MLSMTILKLLELYEIPLPKIETNDEEFIYKILIRPEIEMRQEKAIQEAKDLIFNK